MSHHREHPGAGRGNFRCIRFSAAAQQIGKTVRPAQVGVIHILRYICSDPFDVEKPGSGVCVGIQRAVPGIIRVGGHQISIGRKTGDDQGMVEIPRFVPQLDHIPRQQPAGINIPPERPQRLADAVGVARDEVIEKLHQVGLELQPNPEGVELEEV